MHGKKGIECTVILSLQEVCGIDDPATEMSGKDLRSEIERIK